MGTLHVTGFDGAVESNVGSFVTNLPELLGAMFVDSRAVVAVVEFADGRYVQFWAHPRDLLVFEVVSNELLGGERALSASGEQRLREAGWLEPRSTSSPNWRFDAHDEGELWRGVAMTRRAVIDVLQELSVNPVTFRSWFARCAVTSPADFQPTRCASRRA